MAGSLIINNTDTETIIPTEHLHKGWSFFILLYSHQYLQKRKAYGNYILSFAFPGLFCVGKELLVYLPVREGYALVVMRSK